jgi:hypothetical protein
MPPTITSDRVCVSCVLGQTFKPEAGSQTSCRPVAPCSPTTQFENAGGWRECGVGEGRAFYVDSSLNIADLFCPSCLTFSSLLPQPQPHASPNARGESRVSAHHLVQPVAVPA